MNRLSPQEYVQSKFPDARSRNYVYATGDWAIQWREGDRHVGTWEPTEDKAWANAARLIAYDIEKKALLALGDIALVWYDSSRKTSFEADGYSLQTQLSLAIADYKAARETREFYERCR